MHLKKVIKSCNGNQGAMWKVEVDTHVDAYIMKLSNCKKKSSLLPYLSPINSLLQINNFYILNDSILQNK